MVLSVTKFTDFMCLTTLLIRRRWIINKFQTLKNIKVLKIFPVYKSLYKTSNHIISNSSHRVIRVSKENVNIIYTSITSWEYVISFFFWKPWFLFYKANYKSCIYYTQYKLDVLFISSNNDDSRFLSDPSWFGAQWFETSSKTLRFFNCGVNDIRTTRRCVGIRLSCFGFGDCWTPSIAIN